jgi:protein-serine/threonine kinase
LLEDGTHIHHLTLPAPNRITASLNGLVTGIANKSLRLTSQWTTDRKITLEEIKKERDAVDARLHRTPETRSLQDKWGTCQEVIGKGTSGVVKIARKTDPVTNTEKLYAVKV